MVDILLFKLKHWQMFLLAIAATLVNAVFFAQEPGWRGVVGDVLPSFFIFGWLMILGTRLNTKLDSVDTKEYRFFMASGVFMFVLVLGSSFFTEELQNVVAENTAVFIIVWLACFVVAIKFLAFIARSMKSLEKRREPSVEEYGGDVFLWGAWFVGVWFLAPRLNLIYMQYFRERES